MTHFEGTWSESQHVPATLPSARNLLLCFTVPIPNVCYVYIRHSRAGGRAGLDSHHCIIFPSNIYRIWSLWYN